MRLKVSYLLLSIFISGTWAFAGPIPLKCACPAKPWGTIYTKPVGFWGIEKEVFEVGAVPNQDFCLYLYPACAERDCVVEMVILETGEKITERRLCDTVPAGWDDLYRFDPSQSYIEEPLLSSPTHADQLSAP